MFIARQPIFNNTMNVYGYELLHRDNEHSTSFSNISAEKASAQVLGGLFESGIAHITNNKKAFINFDYNFLLSDSIELIDPDYLIIEILEDVKIDDVLIDRIMELKEKGYQIALDDFVEDYSSYPIAPISNIIKFDILETPLETIKGDVDLALMDGKVILAEKVETKEDFEKAKEMGFNLFQGYFFEKPKIIGQSCHKKSVKLNYTKIASELQEEEPSYEKIVEIIKTDVNLAYRLFRIAKNNNTDDQISSIHNALVLMGFNQINRWINLLILQDLTVDKPLELMRLSLIRSNFGETITSKSTLKSKHNEASTMFLFSTLDAMLDRPMNEALNAISVTDDIREALVDAKGELAPLLQLVSEYGKGNWHIVDEIAPQLGVNNDDIYSAYLASLDYCKKTMNAF